MPDFNIDELTTAFAAATAAARKKLGSINVLVAGSAGVGKSTLINAAFGKNVAIVGIGFSQTKEIKGHQLPDNPLTLYDTPGFEISRSEQTVGAVKNCIREKRNSPNEDDQIHIAWTCILEQSHRIEAVHKSLLSMLHDYEVPSIVVITQSLGDSEMQANVQKLAVPHNLVIPVLAAQKSIAGNSISAHGVGELIEHTIALLPEARRAAFISAQKVRWDLKEAEILKLIDKNAAIGAGSALIPLPGGHSVALVALQLSMIAQINVLLGLSLTEAASKELVSAIGGIMLAKMGGQYAFALGLSEASKFFPGINFIGMALIGGPIGGATTKAFGHLYYNSVVGYAKREQFLPPVDDLLKQMSGNFKTHRSRYETLAKVSE